MSCQSTVQSALESVKGVESAKVLLADHEAVVTYDPSVVKLADLIRAVNHAQGMAHYTATVKSKSK